MKMWKRSLLCGTLAAVTALSCACAAPAQSVRKAELSARPIARGAAESPDTQVAAVNAEYLPGPDEVVDLTPKPLGQINPVADMVDLVRPMADSKLNLTIPAVFNITRPDEALTTTYSSYFITGTSNPDLPVFYEGEEISRLGAKGTFGVLVSLAMGTNTFTFSQDGESRTVKIVRKADTVSAIHSIRQDSMFPAVHGGAQAGGTIPVSCVAPSGAEVSASFGGSTVKLTQTSQASQGVAASFSAKLSVGTGYTARTTEKAGPVTYTMRYNGETKTYQSTGDVYVAGEGAGIVLQVTSYMGFVYPDLNKLSQFKDKVKAGARDYMVDQGNNYFKLASGGWIPVDMVRILEGENKISNTLSDASSDFGSSREVYTFSGTRSPFYYSREADGTFYLSLYNTSNAPKPSVSSSRIFSSVTATERDDGSVLYAFKLREGAGIWGYDVSFDGGDTVLKFNYRPKLSTSSATPLEGVRIMLDPGHGGTDPGALGVAGKTGPDEKTVNLAHAYAIRDRLEALGAKVVLTREDSYFSLDDRLRVIEEWDADLFLSIHHNSMGVNGDANKASGLEMYYHTKYSGRLANKMMTSLTTNMSRNNRFVSQSYFRVTLSPYAPAILMELGFMSNPLEYERAATQSQIDKVADAVAEGVINTIKLG